MNNGEEFKGVAPFILLMLRPFKFSILIMIIVGIIWAIDLSLRPYVLKIIIDHVSESPAQNVLAHAMIPGIIYFLMALIPPTIFRIYDYFISIKMIPNLHRNIPNASFDLLLKQSYSFYQNNFAGRLGNQIDRLTNSIPEIIQIAIDRFFSHGMAILIATFILSQISSVFAIGMFTWVFLCVTGALIISKKVNNFSDNWASYSSIINGKLVDSLSNILSVSLFARGAKEKTSLNESLDDAFIAEQKLQWMYFWTWFCFGFSFVIVQGLNLYFLLKGRQDGWILVGDFVVVLSINLEISGLLWECTRDFSQFSKLWGKTAQALRSIQVIPEIQDSLDAKELHLSKGKIIFDNVRFHYKGTNPLFQNLSLTIEAGQKVGLVGYSGGGKTTFANLILRLYDINDGRIFIDNQDIRHVTKNSLRENIGMIPQDSSLFHRSLMDNIRYGRTDATDEQVVQAAKSAHAHEFITRLTAGYETLVGERGVKLSGGQRQRIAIARAFLKNAPILILDEATSQLDSITEVEIQQSLWELMQGKTTIVIAHRLSTLLHMDRILVFEKGNIVGDASHEVLLEQGGLYKTLWDAQIGGFLPNAA